MTRLFRAAALSACLGLFSVLTATGGQPDEYVTTSPVVVDGVLYVASFDEPWRQGHLRAIDINGTIPNVLWDAADRVPRPGTGRDPGGLTESDPPERIDRDNRYRSLFTNLGSSLVPLTVAAADRLQESLGVTNVNEASQLLYALRGRDGTSPRHPTGTHDAPFRLGAISRSSPVMVGRSATRPTERDRVLYVGAEDGLLHAILASRWNPDGAAYLGNDPAGGAELWGYLPGSFLSRLKDQLDPASPIGSALHLDGSPATGDFFVSLAGDGRRHWHTLLATTGTVLKTRQSSLFVMDVSDPYQPGLLWECLLPGEAMGRSRGTLLAAESSSMRPQLYLTADHAGGGNPGGVQAVAVDALTGRLRWQFSAAYTSADQAVNDTPAVPAMMDHDGNGEGDTLLFGDMAGRLWAIDRADGRPLGDAPVFEVPAGAGEPIGAGVAVRGRVAIFGTGGVAHADNNGHYAVYAVEVLPQGGRLLWSYSLAAGEKVWDTPTLDAAGNVFFATAIDYLPQERRAATSGRIVSLDTTGVERLSRPAIAATIGRVATPPGLAISVALTGEVTQFGAASGEQETSLPSPARVRLLSWRQR